MESGREQVTDGWEHETGELPVAVRRAGGCAAPHSPSSLEDTAEVFAYKRVPPLPSLPARFYLDMFWREHTVIDAPYVSS